MNFSFAICFAAAYIYFSIWRQKKKNKFGDLGRDRYLRFIFILITLTDNAHSFVSFSLLAVEYDFVLSIELNFYREENVMRYP